MELRLHPAIPHVAAMLGNVPKNTGKTLDEWTELIHSTGIADYKAGGDWVKEQGVSGGAAKMIARYVLDPDRSWFSDEAWMKAAPGLVDGQYAGKKEHLRPLYEAILARAEGLGDDIAMSPCKTYVPLYRKRVVAQIKPATMKRIDLGLALGDFDGEIAERVIPVKNRPPSDRISHRIEVTAPDDIDAELVKWLQTAYMLDE